MGGNDSREHVSILALKGEALFFQHFDGPYYPTLQLLHRCEWHPLQCIIACAPRIC